MPAAVSTKPGQWSGFAFAAPADALNRTPRATIT
jgi:hypothetical protein